MPRIRQLADVYAAKDRKKAGEVFWQVMADNCYDYGIKTKKDFSAEIGLDDKTIRGYEKDPFKMQMKTVRKIVEVFKPDITTMLVLLGYTEGEIRHFARTFEN